MILSLLRSREGSCIKQATGHAFRVLDLYLCYDTPRWEAEAMYGFNLQKS